MGAVTETLIDWVQVSVAEHVSRGLGLEDPWVPHLADLNSQDTSTSAKRVQMVGQWPRGAENLWESP